MAKPVALSKLSKTELIKTVRKLMARERKLLNQLATYETQYALDQMRIAGTQSSDGAVRDFWSKLHGR